LILSSHSLSYQNNWFEEEYNVKLGIRFDEENPDNFDEVIEAIKNS
jgi:hypothetical protein